MFFAALFSLFHFPQTLNIPETPTSSPSMFLQLHPPVPVSSSAPPAQITKRPFQVKEIRFVRAFPVSAYAVFGQRERATSSDPTQLPPFTGCSSSVPTLLFCPLSSPRRSITTRGRWNLQGRFLLNKGYGRVWEGNLRKLVLRSYQPF